MSSATPVNPTGRPLHRSLAVPLTWPPVLPTGPSNGRWPKKHKIWPADYYADRRVIRSLRVGLSLQLTVHVHQGLTAFGQKLLLMPLCVPTASMHCSGVSGHPSSPSFRRRCRLSLVRVRSDQKLLSVSFLFLFPLTSGYLASLKANLWASSSTWLAGAAVSQQVYPLLVINNQT